MRTYDHEDANMVVCSDCRLMHTKIEVVETIKKCTYYVYDMESRGYEYDPSIGTEEEPDVDKYLCQYCLSDLIAIYELSKYQSYFSG